MNTRIRRIALCLAILQLLLLFVACGPEETPTTEKPTTEKPTTEAPTTQNKVETPTTERPTTETPTTEEPLPYEETLYLTLGGEAQYVVVIPENATGEMLERSVAFCEQMTEKTGVTFRTIQDSRAPIFETEILVNAFQNREYARPVRENPSYTESISDVIGETIVMIPYAGHLEWMFNRIVSLTYENEDGDWVIMAEDLIYARDVYSGGGIPYYDTAEGEMIGGDLYFGNRTGYMVGYTKTNRQELEAYLAKLEAKGYEKYTENEIGKVEFFTYVKGADALYVRFATLANDCEVKVTLASGEFIPATEPEPYEKLVDSNIVTLERLDEVGHGGSSGLWGLNLIYQLADGSFIIVDGSLYTPGHEKMLYDYLMANKPAQHEKPIISCWLWTHGHGDHVDICKNMIARYNDKIEVKAFAYNYPDWSVLPSGVNPGHYFGDGLVEDTKRYYPEAKHWIMRSGQRMYIADAVIECVWSHEDTYPMQITGVNDADTVFSITIDGIKCMMLGDCQTPNSKMISYYEHALKSVVVQNAHHTLNGPRKMYEYIDPIISYWANVQSSVDNYTYDHAVYLRNTKWTRTNEKGETVTGDRTHYSHSYTAVVYIKDLKEAYGNLK